MEVPCIGLGLLGMWSSLDIHSMRGFVGSQGLCWGLIVDFLGLVGVALTGSLILLACKLHRLFQFVVEVQYYYFEKIELLQIAKDRIYRMLKSK